MVPLDLKTVGLFPCSLLDENTRMNDNHSNSLVYLDHNVLDSMIKNDPFQVKNIFDNPIITAVFSNENLKEILKSKGYEDKFLEILREIKAKHIKSVLDDKFIPTGQAELHEIDPGCALASYVETTTPFIGTDYGLSGMLQKFYGGQTDTTFGEILDEGANNLMKMLRSTTSNLKDQAGMDPHLFKQINQLVNQMPEVFALINQQLADSLDSSTSNSQVRQFEDATGIAPINLKNIKGPDIVLQIWEVVKEKLPSSEMDIETFFGIRTTPWCSSPDREPTTSEKVNAIYHQLNFLGYYRDSKMKVERRFNASFSDMTHAGMASFCHVFICRDEDLVMKAAAAYEYLKVGTQIHFLK